MYPQPLTQWDDFNVFFNKYVHELVTIDTDFIHARFKYETQQTPTGKDM